MVSKNVTVLPGSGDASSLKEALALKASLGGNLFFHQSPLVQTRVDLNTCALWAQLWAAVTQASVPSAVSKVLIGQCGMPIEKKRLVQSRLCLFLTGALFPNVFFVVFPTWTDE